jgi:hypothetical protein
MIQEYNEGNNGIRHIFYQKFLTNVGEIEATFEINLPFLITKDKEFSFFGNSLYPNGKDVEIEEVIIVLKKDVFSHVKVILEDCPFYKGIKKEELLELLNAWNWHLIENIPLKNFDKKGWYHFNFSQEIFDEEKNRVYAHLEFDLPFIPYGGIKLLQDYYKEPNSLCTSVSTSYESGIAVKMLDGSKFTPHKSFLIDIWGIPIFKKNINKKEEEKKFKISGWKFYNIYSGKYE